MSESFFFNFLIALLIPFIGAFIYGIERVVKARMQNRIGPPVLQPFYDLFKLAQKRALIIHSFHSNMGILHFFATWFSTALLFLGEDILIVIFFHLLATSLLLLGSYSVKSQYSQIGSHRELIMLFGYEPIFILLGITLFSLGDSFAISDMQFDGMPLLSAPLAFLAFLVAALMKLKKSPFDAAEAHQELLGGAEIEYSGIYYEALYGAKMNEYVYIYGFCFLLAGKELLAGFILCAILFLLINLIDNATARLKTGDALKIALAVGFIAPFLNLALLYLGV